MISLGPDRFRAKAFRPNARDAPLFSAWICRQADRDEASERARWESPQGGPSGYAPFALEVFFRTAFFFFGGRFSFVLITAS
jgi:hypothetical protein